jgi:hypothetical protein
VEGVDLGAVPGGEGRMLLHAVWMKPVNPENRVIDAIADGIGPVVLWELLNPAERATSATPIPVWSIMTINPFRHLPQLEIDCLL